MISKTLQILLIAFVLIGLPLLGRIDLYLDKAMVLTLIIGSIFHFLAPYTSPRELITPNQLDRNSTLALVGSCTTMFLLNEIQYAYFPQGLQPRFFLLGLFFAVFGLALRAWTTKTLGDYFTTNVTMKHDQEFITHGPYQWVRHPAYVATLNIMLGLCLIFGSTWGITGFVLLVVPAYVYRVEIEEHVLQKQFGESYRQHAQKTKKLFPWVY